MRINFLLDNLSIGGIPRNVLRLAASIADQVEDYQICVMHGGAAAVSGLEGIDAKRMRICSNSGRAGQYRHLRAAMEEFGPAIISCHGHVSQFYYSLYRRMNRKRPVCVTFMHGVPPVRGLRSWLYWQLFRIGLSDADAIVCVAKHTRERLIGFNVPEEKLHVVPNCVPHGMSVQSSPKRREKNAPFVLGYLGRISHGKRVDVLLEALARVSNSGLHCRLLIGGKGVLEEALKKQADQLGIASCVEFLGYVEKPLEFLRRIDALVLLSDSEGMPVSLLEAAAVGVPVIANDVGGIPEIVTNETNGLLLSGLSIGPICESIARLAKDEDLRFRLAAEQLRLAKSTFSAQARAAAALAVYRDAITRRNGANSQNQRLLTTA